LLYLSNLSNMVLKNYYDLLDSNLHGFMGFTDFMDYYSGSPEQNHSVVTVI